MIQPLEPEEQARVLIDAQLTRAGWHVCDRKDIDLVNHRGNAVREVIMAKDHGRADYLLYVDKKVVGAIEAKPDGAVDCRSGPDVWHPVAAAQPDVEAMGVEPICGDVPPSLCNSKRTEETLYITHPGDVGYFS